MTTCNWCRRILDIASDPLSADCGGACWGCIGETEAEMGYGPSIEKYNKEVRAGLRKGPIITPSTD